MVRILPPAIPLLLLSLAACSGSKPDPLDTGGLTDGGSPDDDGDGYTADEDCDDNNALVNTGAIELCDGVDNNCDGAVDEGVTTTFYADADSDGFGDARTTTEACELPGGHVTIGSDCDDSSAAVYPSAPEVCNTIDDDCDGLTDEGVASTFYADSDGDGYGDPVAALEACAPPSGYLDNDEDCDDTDDTAFPGGVEVCDEADNDCDGTVDEDVTTTFYQDVDGDTYGVADLTTEACTLPTGYSTTPGDCDDSTTRVSPAAAEVCNTIDDDCDGLTDEPDAADAASWYADADSDGYGDAAVAVIACSSPSGYVSDATDCDDTDGDTWPGADEYCDGEDDDCDGTIDESSALDADTWWLDYDSDGYGGSKLSTVACSPPSGYVATSSDCDDGDDDIYPGADEYCNGDDDDCDGTTDEDDALDALDWYADDDSDGYGDAADMALACSQPSGRVSLDTDCDDTDGTIYPGADEYCDEVDNDCDGTTDEDTAVDADTWYADTDGDGYGDPDVEYAACEQPSGTVDNANDCDDTDPNDTDSDGQQDCEDDDIDGDGLRNDWDADPYDDSIARGPTGGLGGDGDWTASGTTTQGDWTLLDGSASSSDTDIDVDDGTLFAAGDEILVLSQQGTDAGTWQTVFVSGVSGDTLTIEPPLEDSYSSSSVVLVQRIPHYGKVSIPSGATLRSDTWAGSGGGVVIFRATGAVTIGGTVTVAERGFRGGEGVSGNSSNPRQGESYRGLGSTGVSTANYGGGGAYPRRGDNGDGGGGGGYGSTGSAGTNYGGSSVTSGGASYGSSSLATWYLGSGGGGGSPDTESDGSDSRNVTGDGGSGGGIIALFSATSISVTGAVSADGADGEDATSREGEVGGGGAGAGGTVYLAAPSLTLSSSTVVARGGDGGSSAWHSGKPYGSAYGGDGSSGRIRLDYTSLSGSTTPTAGYTASYTD